MVSSKEAAMFSQRSTFLTAPYQTVRGVVWAGGEASTMQAIVFTEEKESREVAKVASSGLVDFDKES